MVEARAQQKATFDMMQQLLPALMRASAPAPIAVATANTGDVDLLERLAKILSGFLRPANS